MVNFAFYIIGRKNSNQERALRININEWHELLFTLCPNFAGSTREFKFKREDVLTDEEIEMLEKISYDEQAVSILEGYEEYKEPNFESAYKWNMILKKIEAEYFKTEKEGFVKSIKASHSDETEILKVIRRVRSSQFHFDQIKQTLNVAKEKDLEIAFTISDY